MLVFTAANHAFSDFLERNGSQFSLVYNLGGLGYGIQWKEDVSDNTRDIRRRKPRYMLEAVMTLGQRCVWIDTDAVIRQPFSEMETDDYDVAMPIRLRTDTNIMKPKATVMFFNPTHAAKEFLAAWIARIPNDARGDQSILRAMIGEHYSLETSTYKENGILNINGCRVKMLDRATYCWDIKKREDLYRIPEQTRIVHFSGWAGKKKLAEKRKYFKEYMDALAR